MNAALGQLDGLQVLAYGAVWTDGRPARDALDLARGRIIFREQSHSTEPPSMYLAAPYRLTNPAVDVDAVRLHPPSCITTIAIRDNVRDGRRSRSQCLTIAVQSSGFDAGRHPAAQVHTRSSRYRAGRSRP